MNDELRPFSNYKETGLLWLGAVPAHWDVRRNGRLFAQRNETGFGNLPILEVSLKTGVRVRDMENMKRKQVMNDREKYKRAAKGDIAYNMMRMWQGALGAVPVDGLVSPAYVVARPFTGTETRYFSYLFRTAAYMAEVDGYSRGIVKDRNRLYWEDFKRMPSCYPLPEEQTGIADYLDANAILVRKFIRNRRRLIEVLNEQKQAIINQAVTRGLDPNAPLKPSGVAWLGNVPVDWDVKRIKHVFRETDRRSGTGDGVLLSLTRRKGLVPHSEVSDRPPSASDLSKYKVCVPGELIMNRMQAWSGMFATATREGLISPDYSVFSAVGDVHVQYFEFLFKTRRYIDQFAAKSKGIGSGFNRLYTPEFGSIPIAVPPKPVQEQLLDRIEVESRDLNALIDRANREIDLIREYRTRLIADVVTGKLDVRHMAPKIDAVEADELAAIDAEEDFDGDLPEGDEAELVEEGVDGE